MDRYRLTGRRLSLDNVPLALALTVPFLFPLSDGESASAE